MEMGMEKKIVAAEMVDEEEEKLLGEVAVLDFDMLCSTVAMQTQKGKWGILNVHDEVDENGGGGGSGSGGGGGGAGAFRMWEGELIYDFCDDRRIAIQSACCPCYKFGKNMKRAGFGNSFLQGFVYVLLAVIALLCIVTYIVTKRRSFLYLSILFAILIGVYLGYFRTLIRRKFNIRDSDSPLDDCVFHMICPCCTLSQESRTLEMNNVQDGIWHGRGDTICIGSYPDSSKTFFQLTPPPIVSANYPDPQKIVIESTPS